MFSLRFEIDVEQFPNLARIEKNLESLEPFKKAHANRQPDYPPELTAWSSWLRDSAKMGAFYLQSGGNKPNKKILNAKFSSWLWCAKALFSVGLSTVQYYFRNMYKSVNLFSVLRYKKTNSLNIAHEFFIDCVWPLQSGSRALTSKKVNFYFG